MIDQPLHPNLARIAAEYDAIVTRCQRGEVSGAKAHADVLALAARDDQGVLWSIDPDSGAWRRRTVTGEQVLDTPPTYGVATPTAYDLSPPNGTTNPDEHVDHRAVDESVLLPPDSLVGSTRREPMTSLPKGRFALLVLATSGGLLGVGWFAGSLLSSLS